MMDPITVADGTNINKDVSQHQIKPVQYPVLENDLIMRENEMQFSRYEYNT